MNPGGLSCKWHCILLHFNESWRGQVLLLIGSWWLKSVIRLPKGVNQNLVFRGDLSLCYIGIAQFIYCITLCIHDIVLFWQFLDECSNLKAECRKNVIHDAFDAIYVSYYIDNRSRDFLCIFFHLRPVMVDTVRSLPPEPAVLCAHALHEQK